MASKQAIEAGRAFVRLFLKNDMTRQLVRALRNGQTKLRNFSQSAIGAGRRIAVAGVLMAAPFAFATRTFAQFDDAMREVGAVTQATADDFELLTDKAKKLGASTSFTAIEVASLMAELGRAGFVPPQIDEMTGSVLALARATKTEGADAAGIMATAIRQFALDAGDASRVADVLTTAANKSFNTLESLGESLKFVGPVAKDFNISLEDTVAVLGTLGNVGIQGTMAGTTMRRILLATGAEAKRLKKIFGVEFVDINGNVRPLVDTLEDIANATRELGSAARAKKFKDAFGLRGITGASAIGRNITGTRELRDAIGEAGGIAEETAAKMDAGLGGAFRILKSAIEGVQIAVGEALAPTLQKLVKFITQAVQSSIKWIQANTGVIVALAATAVGVGALGVALTVVGAAALAASIVLGAVATVISFIASPLGALVAVLAAGAVAWVKFTDSGKRALAVFSTAFGDMIGDATTAWGGIAAALKTGDLEAAFKIVSLTMQLEWARMVKFWMDETLTFRTWWNEVSFGLSSMFIDAVAGMKTAWVGLLDLMKNPLFERALKILAPGVGVAIDLVAGNTEPTTKEGVESDRKAAQDVLAASMARANVQTQGGAGAAEIALAKATRARDNAVDQAKDDAAVEAFKASIVKLFGRASGALGGVGEALGGGGGSGPLSSKATSTASAVPKGIALTATYSAAAARISGFQAGNGPEQQMAVGIDKVAVSTSLMVNLLGAFIAGLRVQ